MLSDKITSFNALGFVFRFWLFIDSCLNQLQFFLKISSNLFCQFKNVSYLCIPFPRYVLERVSAEKLKRSLSDFHTQFYK